MKRRVISVDQSTQSTKAFLFAEDGRVLARAAAEHAQYYPREGWSEHDPMELYANAVNVIAQVVKEGGDGEGAEYSLAITNQRETVVIWDRRTGKPIYNAVVWQCTRGEAICAALKARGCEGLVRERTGLLIDPYFSASGAKWILDNVAGARESAEAGNLLLGTVDAWLVWKLTGGRVHATDYTNASRTMLFNVHTLDWDDDLLGLFGIPRSMMPEARPCDALFGGTTVEGLFGEPVGIAGVLGDSHGALVGQMCFREGLGKTTYGTGSSVMVNIGEKYSDAPQGLVTSVGFAAQGKLFYAFEGNVHCTGGTVSWLRDRLGLIGDASEVETLATSVPDNGGVYFIPAFSGLGAPWWQPEARGRITGLTLNSTKAHLCRAALESIAYQVTDLCGAMLGKAGIVLKEMRVDGGPTKDKFLMQLQSDLLQVAIVRSEVEDASAFGVFVMNGLAIGRWSSFDEAESVWRGETQAVPRLEARVREEYGGWQRAVRQMINEQ